MTITTFLNSLIENVDQKVSIRGTQKSIIGFAEFKTINLGDDGYFKITFDDHSFLFIVPSEDLLLYTDELPKPFTEIKDEEIGAAEKITFRGREYVLENANDYQYVVRLMKGDFNTIEGEVSFSDYVPVDGASELLSLGWIVRTSERADVNPKEITMDEIKLV